MPRLLILVVASIAGAVGLVAAPASAVVEADLEVQASALTEDRAEVGTSHEQNAVLVNHGPAAATSVVVEISASNGQQLSAPVGGGLICTNNAARSVLTCRRTGLSAGTSIGITWTTTYTTPGDKTVLVTAFASQSDPEATNNAAVIVTAGVRADLRISAEDQTGGPAVVGGTHTFGGTVFNDGPDTAKNVVVTVSASPGQRLVWDSAAGFTCTTNPARSVVTCKRPTMQGGLGVGLFWSAEYTKPGPKTIMITTSSSTPEPEPSDNSVVVATRGEESDLSLTLQDAGGEDPAQIGQTRQQGVFLTNDGPDATASATVTITASKGQTLTPENTGAVDCTANSARTVITCRRSAAMQPGLGVGIYWTTTFTEAGPKSVTVEATGPNRETDPSDNRLTIQTEGAVADVGVDATDLTGGHVVLRATHDQRAAITNDGPDDAVGVLVTITASAGQKLDLEPTAVATCTVNGNKTVITCTRASMAPGLSFYLYWKVTYTSRTAKTVTVRASSPNQDPQPVNNIDVINTGTQA